MNTLNTVVFFSVKQKLFPPLYNIIPELFIEFIPQSFNKYSFDTFTRADIVIFYTNLAYSKEITQLINGRLENS